MLKQATSVRQSALSGESLRCGDARIHALPLGSAELGWDVLEHANPDDAHDLTRIVGRPVLHGHAFVVRTAQQVVAIDAGMHAGGPFDGLRTSLRREAIDEDEVQTVLITHLHPDHAGGLLDGLYPDASVVVPDAEIAFATDAVALRAANPWVQGNYSSAPAVLDAIGGRMIRLSEAALPPGFRPMPLPGHSPGHTGYVFESGSTGAESVLFAADLLHLPEVQLHCPTTSSVGDFDPAAAAVTREATLRWLAETGAVMAGAHVGAHPFTRLVSSTN